MTGFCICLNLSAFSFRGNLFTQCFFRYLSLNNDIVFNNPLYMLLFFWGFIFNKNNSISISFVLITETNLYFFSFSFFFFFSNTKTNSAGVRPILRVPLQHDLHRHAGPRSRHVRQGRGRANVAQVLKVVLPGSGQHVL